MTTSRFSGAAGQEYDLFRMACPHFDELENEIGRIIKGYFGRRFQDKINTLEIGCGPGYTTLIVLDADERVNVVAVDNEPVMIAQAHDILRDYVEGGRVTLVEEDALVFLKRQCVASFDAFSSGFTLHNFEQDYRREVMREIYRVLKPNGLFVNADKYALDDEQEHQRTLDWQLEQFQTVYSSIGRPDLIEEWTRHYLEDNKPEVLMKEWESKNFMRRIGFSVCLVVYRKQMEAVMFGKK